MRGTVSFTAFLGECKSPRFLDYTGIPAPCSYDDEHETFSNAFSELAYFRSKIRYNNNHATRGIFFDRGSDMSTLKRILCLVLFVSSCTAYGGVLPSGALLFQNQSVFSSNGKYYAIMQSDGNFVMYRTDGVVRFATYKSGSFIAMQTDGNLVEYNSASQPLWWTPTAGYPGAFMSVQDDGNLVVYSAGSTPLWNIGADAASDDGPSAVGDVVARDLAYLGLSFIGHTGMWTGSNIAEVVSGRANAVRYVSWQDFKTTSKPWPTARPNVPNHLIYYCFTTSCQYYNSAYNYTGVSARMALARRANQIYLIGADYTLSGFYTIADPALPGQLATRGTYRCDTFIVDVYASTQGWNLYHTIPVAWQTRMTNLFNAPKTPWYVWNALKN